MLGKSYRVPRYPIRPGDYTAPDEWFEVFTQQPVRSLIVRPSRCSVTRSPHVKLEGKAWSGAGDVVMVELSYDAGLTWTPARLSPPANKWAWQRWTANITLPSQGVWNIFVRATDHTGATQPMLVPSWNPGGYANNQMMKIDVEVLADDEESAAPHCTVCGHVYDPTKDCGGRLDPARDCGGGVAFEDLPETWRCPVCGAAKSRYRRVATAEGTALWVEHALPSEALVDGRGAPVDLWKLSTFVLSCAVAVLLYLRRREAASARDCQDAMSFTALH